MAGDSGQHTLLLNMLGSVARRSRSAAAADHMKIRALPAGGGESSAIAAQQLKDRVNEHQIQYSYTMP